MGAMASQITSLAIVYSSVNSGADQRKHQSSASLAFVRGIHRGPVNSLHKGSVTRKMFPFDDVIMKIFLVDAFYFFINTPPLPPQSPLDSTSATFTIISQHWDDTGSWNPSS